jgi:hypothetical protein
MLGILRIEEIQATLLVVPDLVQQQERRDAGFAAHVGAWLKSLDDVLAANRLYQAGSIAALRSRLIAAERGQVPAGLESRGGASRSRVLQGLASQVLERAVEIASNVMAENQGRLVEAERVARQIVAAALSRELIAAREPKVANTQYLQMLRRNLSASADLETALVHLEGLVGPQDLLIFLDRALAPHLVASTG